MKEFFEKIYGIFFVCFQNSLFGKACLTVEGSLRRLGEKSLLCRFLGGESFLAAVKSSLAFKWVTGLFGGIFAFSQRWGQRLTKESRLIGAVQGVSAYAAYLWQSFLFYAGESLLFSRFIKDKKGQARPEKINFPKAGLFGLLVLLALFWAALGLKLGTAAWCGLIALVVLAFWPKLGVYAAVALAPFIPTMALAGLLFVTGGCFILRLLFGRGLKFYLDQTGLFLLLFSGILLFFGFTSYTPVKSLQIAALEILFVFSYFLILSLLQKKEDIRRLIFLFCTSAAFTGFIGLYQYLSGRVDVTWTDTELFEEITLRVYSTFENPNVYGEYLLLALPVALIMIFLARGVLGKLYYGAVSALLLVNLALTYSRGCYLALLFSGFLFAAIAARPLLLLAVPGVAALPFVLPASIIARFTSITNFTDTSTAYRLNIWQGTVRMLTDFWALGIGLGQEAFNRVYPKYSLNAIVAPHSHNLYLQIFLEMGIAGLFTFFAVMAAFVNTGLRAMKKGKWGDKLFLAALLAAFGGFLLQGGFDYVWYNYRVFCLFFMTLGLGGVASAAVEKGEELF